VELSYYQSIGLIVELARSAAALPRAADAAQLFRRVAERLAASARPRAEVVVRERGVDVAPVLLCGEQVSAPRHRDELAVIPADDNGNYSLQAPAPSTTCTMDFSRLGACRRLRHDAANATQQRR